MIAAGLVDHHPVPHLGGRGDDIAGELAEVGHVDLGHDEGEHARATGAQGAGDGVRAVVQLVDRVEHALAHLVAHVGVAAHDVRHSADGDLGAFGDVAQCCRHPHLPDLVRAAFDDRSVCNVCKHAVPFCTRWQTSAQRSVPMHQRTTRALALGGLAALTLSLTACGPT